ncbi:MAG: LysE family translocator [Porphyromonadaceae bacterium]|nr:LysE family translocator [Porphyromonadaceae bacterium]
MTAIELLLYIIIRGLLIGILVSAPMGPIGVLCIQRTLNKGRLSGLATGIGASLSDILYSMIAGFGLSITVDFIEQNQAPLQIVGSLVLAGFAIYLYRQNPVRNIRKNLNRQNSFAQDFASSFLLTLSNPLILFLIIGLYARLNFFLPEMRPGHYIIAYLSIITGAFIWWFTITFIINKFRSRFSLRSLWLINRGIGTIILLMSLIGIGTGLYKYLTL